MRPWEMSLLGLPERIFRRLVELPLELFSEILGSQKLLTDNVPMYGRDLYTYERSVTAANDRGVRLRRKREEHRARHAGEWRLPGNIHGRTGRGAVGYNAQPPYGSYIRLSTWQGVPEASAEALPGRH